MASGCEKDASPVPSRTALQAEVRRFAREGAGAFHIYGPAGIGKSCLVRDALGDSSAGDIVRVSARTAAGPTGFWRSLADALGSRGPRASDPDEAWVQAVDAAERRPQRTLIVAEDLDALRSHAGGIAALHRLIGLAEYGPRQHVVVLGVSRRRLEVLLADGPHTSVAPGCVLTTCVGPWLPEEFLAFMAASRPGLDRATLRRLWARGAAVPGVARALVSQWETRVDASARDFAPSPHHAWFDDLERYLVEDGSFATLLRCVHGPVLREAPTIVSRLMQMGLLTPRRRPFCLALFERLERAHHRGSAFEIWAQTERDLRTVIARVYEKKMGAAWVELLLADDATSSLMRGCDERRAREARIFGRALDHLAYSYPAELWELIQRRWEWFSHLFARDRDKRFARQRWSMLFQDLACVRTPIAHTREEVVPEAKLNVALAVCSELQRVLAPELAAGGGARVSAHP